MKRGELDIPETHSAFTNGLRLSEMSGFQW